MANALTAFTDPVNTLVEGLYGKATQFGDFVAKRYNEIKADPIGDMKRTLQNTVNEDDVRTHLFQRAFADPKHPLRVTDEEAAKHLSEVYGEAVMSFMPAGIVGYHGTTKAFKNFNPKKAAGADDNIAILNALGPHFTHKPEDVNNFLTSTFSGSEKWTENWANKFPHMEDVYPPKANIRKAQVDMKNPFDIGGESFIDDLMSAKSGRDLVSAGRMSPKEMKLADDLVAAKHSDPTIFANNVKSILQSHGYDGISYVGEYSDLMDTRAFVPFNVKSIVPAWGPAK